RIPQQLVEGIIALDVTASGFILIMMALVLLLGMFLESIAIILVTMLVILPAMLHLGTDPVWYSWLLVFNLEIPLKSPPVGMNLFTIKAITQAHMGPIIRGATPYVLLMAAVLLVILYFPSVAMWLPRTMMQ